MTRAAKKEKKAKWEARDASGSTDAGHERRRRRKRRRTRRGDKEGVDKGRSRDRSRDKDRGRRGRERDSRSQDYSRGSRSRGRDDSREGGRRRQRADSGDAGPSEEELLTFRERYPMDDRAFNDLAAAPGEVRQRVLTQFKPKREGEADYSALIASFVRAIITRRERMGGSLAGGR